MHDIDLVPLLYVALLGLVTTSSSLLGAVIGLYCPLSKRVLACVFAFGAGALISALAIEFAFQGVQELHHQGFSTATAWAFAGGGFALGAMIYYSVSLFLETKGAAVRYPTRFSEYARERKRHDAWEPIGLLSRCDLLRHLPPDEIENLLPCVRPRHLGRRCSGLAIPVTRSLSLRAGRWRSSPDRARCHRNRTASPDSANVALSAKWLCSAEGSARRLSDRWGKPICWRSRSATSIT